MLAPDALDIWTIALDGTVPDGDGAESLSPDERARAARYRFGADRQRFVAAHVALRCILAGYVGVAPAALALTSELSGKPTLDARHHPTAVAFNLSHSSDLALVAIARDRDVGVDVERIRGCSDLEAIAARCLSADERRALMPLPPEQRSAAFFRLWTVKEAYLKASGDGLRQDLRQIDVRAGSDPQRPEIRVLDRPESRRAQCYCLTPDPGYAAAVAILTDGRSSSIKTVRHFVYAGARPSAWARDERRRHATAAADARSGR